MHVRPITRADLWDVARIHLDASRDIDTQTMRYPLASQYPLAMIREKLNFSRWSYAQSNTLGFVAVADASDSFDGIAAGGLLGFAWWVRLNDTSYQGPHSGLFWRLEDWLLHFESLYSEYLRPNPAEAPGVWPAMRRVIRAADPRPPLDNPKPGTPHWHLSAMFVAPAAYGRGVGGALLQWGLAAAREEQDPARRVVSLYGSTNGRWLYEKWGIRQVGTVEGGSIALRIPGCQIHSAMLYDPHGYYTEERRGRGPEVPADEKALGFKDYVLFKPELMPPKKVEEEKGGSLGMVEAVDIAVEAEGVA